MTTKVLIISAFGAAAVAAAAAGGYLALRSNAADLAPVQTSAAPPAVEASGAVIEPAQKPEAERVPEVPAVHGTTPRSAHPGGAGSAPTGAQAPAASSPRPEAPAPVAPASAPVLSPDPAPAEVKDPRPEPVPAPVIEPARPVFEEVVVKEDSVIGIRLDGAISTETAHVEDPVTARVARDVTVGGHVAIPAGARLEGSVSVVEHGGKFKDRPRLGIQFHSLILADGTRTKIQTETIFREGDSPTAPAATKVGASAVVGGLLGAVIGGKKGAAIGATTGAAAGGAAVAVMGRPDVTIPAGTQLTVRMTAPVTLSIEREQDPR